MYGALAVSRNILKIDDFWYWMDTVPSVQKSIKWTNFDLHIPDYRTKYRGWFVNDELLLRGWKDHDSDRYVWNRVFETALRVGCNVIVPGTDVSSQINRNPAKSFGLAIAQHHAEPLGAKMFAREYPDLTASFIKYPDLFRKLWRDAIMDQKGTPTIYSLGFRGQGDKPFCEDDNSREWNDQSIADVVNGIIQEQYDMVRELDPEAPMALNIYGELAGLYRKDLIKVPDDVIEIWADSGYGKLVSRRQTWIIQDCHYLMFLIHIIVNVACIITLRSMIYRHLISWDYYPIARNSFHQSWQRLTKNTLIPLN